MVEAPSEIDDFLNGLVRRLYARAQEPGAPADLGSMTVADDPADVDRILKSPDRFRKNYSLLSLLGSSRFSANGPEWDHRRNLTQPSYLQAATTHNRPGIRSVYEAKLANCPSLAPLAVQEALLDAAITVFFGALDCKVDSAALLQFFARFRPILKKAQYFSWVGADPANRAALASQVQSVLRDFVDAVRDTPDLVRLMGRFCHEAKAIAGFEPHEELLMNFFAGIETSAATLSWCITCLAPNPKVQERVHREAIGNEEATPYLECFINETMRYFPAIPFVIRQTASAETIGGTELQPNSLVLLSVVGLHHHPKYWKDPHILNTARAEFLENRYDRRAFVPFLTGPRMCGGARLARLEITEGLKTFLRLYEVRGGTSEFRFDYGLAMRPSSWSHIEIVKRGH
jgi:cytochrome P450